MADGTVQHGEQDIDSGAPFIHGDEPAPKADKAEPSELDKRLAAIEDELKSTKQTLKEAQESERYWASKARGGAPEVDNEETDDEPEPRRALPPEKPEKLLDAISEEGLDAIRKRGFIDKEEVEALVKTRLDKALSEVQEGQAFDTKLGKDFPDLADKESELFKRTGRHFREMAAIDPKAKNSRVALYAAAKLAKTEIDMEEKATSRERSEDTRRERIERQAGDRGRGRGDEPDGGGERELGPQARQIIQNLGRFGVTTDDYKKHAEAGRNGRGR